MVNRMRNAVFLNEDKMGFLVLVNSDGKVIGAQESVNINQEVDNITRVKVVFLLDPASQMYKEGE